VKIFSSRLFRVIESVCVASELRLRREKRKLQKKHIEAKKAKKKILVLRRVRVCAQKKKQKESSLSLFLLILTNTKRKTYKHGGCAFDRFLFCNALPLILSLSFSLSKGRERFFVRFRLKSSYVRHGFLLLFSFVFVCSSVQVVCVSADRLSLFFVRATPARARVSACFLTTTTVTTTTTRAWRSNSRRRRDDYVHAGRSPVANDETIDTSSFYSHRTNLFF